LGFRALNPKTLTEGRSGTLNPKTLTEGGGGVGRLQIHPGLDSLVTCVSFATPQHTTLSTHFGCLPQECREIGWRGVFLHVSKRGGRRVGISGAGTGFILSCLGNTHSLRPFLLMLCQALRVVETASPECHIWSRVVETASPECHIWSRVVETASPECHVWSCLLDKHSLQAFHTKANDHHHLQFG